MYVTSPKLYLKLASHEDEFVPLWLPEKSAAIDVPDPWKERRIMGGHYSSIYHAKLPDSFVKPPGDCGQTGTFWWYNGVVTEPVYKARQYLVHQYFVCHGSTVEQISVGFYVSSDAYYSVYLSWHYLWHAGEIINEYNRSCTYSSEEKIYNTNTSYYLIRNSSQKPTFSQVEGLIRSASVPFTEQTVKRTGKYFECTSPETEASLTKWVGSRLANIPKYGEDTYVDDHWSETPETNVLGQPTGNTIPEEPRGKSIFAKDQLNSMSGPALAYLAALEDFPTVSANSLQNIAGIYQALAHFAFDFDATSSVIDELAKVTPELRKSSSKMAVELRQIPDWARDGWLGARYVWNTSVADLTQGSEWMYHKLLQQMGTVSDDVKCHGTATVDGVVYSCTFRMKERALSGINNFFRKGYEYGLEPNAYVLWDFIPYSFVIDWFLPIGDALDAYTRASEFSPLYYEYVSSYGVYTFCYSMKYTKQTEFGPVEVYSRWYDDYPPNVESSYVLLDSKSSTSSRTACWRFVDALCLVF